MDVKDQLCVAFDVPDLSAAKSLAKALGGTAGFAKVGMELFTAEGPPVLGVLRDAGFKIFLDLKYHDIPNTVGGAVRAAARNSVAMLNVHAQGGSAMLRAAADACNSAGACGSFAVLGVTVLTSIDQETLNHDLRIDGDVSSAALHLAGLVSDAGLAGVVASPKEISMIRAAYPKPFLIVAPGIRPPGSATDDQKRTGTPRAAIDSGADMIVVGRPITQASDPRDAACRILDDIGAG